MLEQPEVGAYVAAVESIIGLTAGVLDDSKRWIALREPNAGELIVPRKTRTGHRVHINPYPWEAGGRQVRASSNFVSFSNCLATSDDVDAQTATRLIAAFLVSSFGQLQFEIEGYNREGLLALEEHSLDRVRVFDPRWISSRNAALILEAFSHLPYPISTDRLSAHQPERNSLDELWAEVIAARFPELRPAEVLSEVHAVLDEWLVARQP
jgi:hypothetical protein